MSEQLIEGQQADIKKLADELREMADRVEMNGPAAFGGCYVVIPPVPGTVLKLLVLRNTQNPATFWGTLKTEAQMAIDSLDDQARGIQQGFGGRR